MVQQLIYVSKALTGTRTEEEMGNIIEVSRVRNGANGISGVLLMRGATLLQLLEGPAAAVYETYARIEKDPRHCNIFKLVDQPAKERLYENWSMAYRELNDADAHLVNEIIGWSNLILNPKEIQQALVMDLIRRFRAAPAPAVTP